MSRLEAVRDPDGEAGHPQRLPRGPGLLGQRHGPGPRSDRRLRPWLPRILGDLLGDLTDEVFLDNDSAWSADHCADALEVPGVLFSNRPIRGRNPSLVDMAPSILAEFGLPTPTSMVGKNIF